MKFIIKEKTGGEVVYDGPPHPDKPVYHGAAPAETGRWRVDIPAFEAHCARHLAGIDFGESIEAYYFCLEIAELQEWGTLFTATSDYTSYRPKMKALVSVGQVEWAEVKHLSAAQQLDAVGDALIASIERITHKKRMPRHFDSAAFATAARILLASCDASMFALPAH